MSPDEATLLCECCGYTLEHLPESRSCPECGTPILDSLPARRSGSPWQRSPTVRSWYTTNLAAILGPRELFRRCSVEKPRSALLLVANCLVAGLLAALPWTGVLLGDPSRGSPGTRGLVLQVAMLGAWTLLVGATLCGLAAIEFVGIRFFGARRRWRVSARVGWLVCGHASVGWIVAPLLALIGLATLTALDRLFGVAPHGVFRVRLGTGFDSGPIGRASALYVAILAGSGLVGLAVFETLVYVGVRRCRFANAPRATIPPAATAPSSV